MVNYFAVFKNQDIFWPDKVVKAIDLKTYFKFMTKYSKKNIIELLDKKDFDFYCDQAETENIIIEVI